MQESIVDAFNVVVGIVALLTTAFSVYTYVDARGKEAIETQKSAEYQQRLADLLSMSNALARQANLIAALADRDEVTKKELKHLTISQLATIGSIQASLERTRAIEQRWQFGVPATYLEIAAPDPATPDPSAAVPSTAPTKP